MRVPGARGRLQWTRVPAGAAAVWFRCSVKEQSRSLPSDRLCQELAKRLKWRLTGIVRDEESGLRVITLHARISVDAARAGEALRRVWRALCGNDVAVSMTRGGSPASGAPPPHGRG